MSPLNLMGVANQDETITTSTSNASATLPDANRVLATRKSFLGASLGALTPLLHGFSPTTASAGMVKQGPNRESDEPVSSINIKKIAYTIHNIAVSGHRAVQGHKTVSQGYDVEKSTNSKPLNERNMPG
ncbi:hypothetical protein N7463_007441 [Penicillium fimorum]|uniref:Uncharacterized protein n=1 Tax=Penicillium fimorum TaxID=1882269 RepID=A0A9W9XWG0_9EURO|nr:hypothetical protein N7463_007441 [Penicillium fimorum]